jgi:hypothetical protein
MFVTYILSKIRAYKLYRQTARGLSDLSDRELADWASPVSTSPAWTARVPSRKKPLYSLENAPALLRAFACVHNLSTQ